LDEVLLKAARIKESLSKQEMAALDLSNLKKELAKSEAKASQIALELHQARVSAAAILTNNLIDTLKVLGFPKIDLKIEVFLLDEMKKNGLAGALAGSKGADRVDFLFAPNPGEGLNPLSKIASGGELSRVMLALKTAQEPRSEQSLVFDEIDSGLSGATAEAVAAKMAELAERQQIFVITHLPQMAALKGRHFLASKSSDDIEDRTVTRFKELPQEDRAFELARMLGGACPSPEAIALSRQLLGIE